MRVVWNGEPESSAEERMLKSVLPLLVHNPFAVPTEMDINLADRWRPYDQQQAIDALDRGRTATLQLRADAPHRLFASIKRTAGRTGALLDLADAYFGSQAAEGMYAKERLSAFVALTLQVARAVPAFDHALANADPDPSTLIEAQHLPNLPSCFVYVAWYHLISPRGYDYFYTREDLLRAPAYSVRELEQGWIELVSYADPWSYETAETQERIVALTHYLDQRRRDRANAQPLRIES